MKPGMPLIHNAFRSQRESTCAPLLSELQKIWDEIGEPGSERDRMILELERECLDAYRRKVDQASQCRAQLRQAIADSEAKLSAICAALGERPVHMGQSPGSLKMELQAIVTLLEEMQKRKYERESQFTEVVEQICSISKELCLSSRDMVIDETDLSLRRLEDLKKQLLALQNEKRGRLKQVLDLLDALIPLCSVLGMDFKAIVREIHPTLDNSCGEKSISLDTIEKLSTTIHKLKDLKIQRMQKLQDLAGSMIELWTLMDTPVHEQHKFQNVTRIIAASENEVTEPNILSLDFISYAETEVLRLQKIKASKTMEFLSKKRLHLEEICREAHMVVDAHDSVEYSPENIESGATDPSYLLEQLELRISQAKEEALNRKELLDKAEKWIAACQEESWLEEYNRVDNRYNVGRGTHLVLKRAEKARALVNKIPAMVDLLKSKAKAWQKERGADFLYDGESLLSMLENYCIIKQEKEQERQRERDQKKIQGQLIAEQEAIYGSKPSPTVSGRKKIATSTESASSKRYSMGGMLLKYPHSDKVSVSSNPLRKTTSSKTQTPRSHNLSEVSLSGKRDDSAKSAKTHSSCSSDQRESEPKQTRKPLSPISSSSLSSKANSDRHEVTGKNQAVMDSLLAKRNLMETTPNSKISTCDENATPKTMPIPMPKTPSTISIPMQTTMTPASISRVPGGTEDVEYSFEERRARFILP